MLTDSLRHTPDLIAAYCSVMDAWDGGYLLIERMPKWFPGASLAFAALLEDDGIAILPNPEHNFGDGQRIDKVKSSLRGEIGDTYARMVLDGIQLVVGMSAATKCPCVMLWRSLSAVIDDSWFQSQ